MTDKIKYEALKDAVKFIGNIKVIEDESVQTLTEYLESNWINATTRFKSHAQTLLDAISEEDTK